MVGGPKTNPCDGVDLHRCIAAHLRRPGALQPSPSECRTYRDAKGHQVIELRNGGGFLGAWSVTPRKVTLMRGVGSVVA